MIDVEAGNGVDVIGQRQPVGRKTQLDVGRGLVDQLEGLEGLFRIGERVAGASDSEHGHLRNGGGDRQHLLGGLLRGQLLADHAGPRFIGAIVFAIAVVALDVAGWRNRHMHARVVVMRFLAVAGMVLDLLPDLGRQIALTRRRSAACLAAATTGAAAFVLRDRLHHFSDFCGAWNGGTFVY